jgi:hypothetical protein
MGLSLRGQTSGAVDINAPAVAGDNTITLPDGNGSANQFYKNSTTAGIVTHSSMVEDSSGNVGIGEAAPGGRLTVKHANTATSGLNATLKLKQGVATNGNRSSLIFSSLDDFDVAAVNGVVEVHSGTSANNVGRLEFWTKASGSNAAERLRITSTGNIGINSTSPGRKLDVVDSGADGSVIRSRVTTNNGGYLAYEALNSSGTSVFSVTHNGRINLAENIVFASGQGIDFSASTDGSGTTSSELLDDYEEGSWTPTAERTSPTSAATYTARSGKYTKIGNVVTIWFDLNWSANPGGSGDYVIGGLPFSAVTGQPSDGGFGAPQFRDASGLSSSIRIYGNSSYHGTTYIYAQQYNSSGNPEASPFNASGRITGWSQYFIS